MSHADGLFFNCLKALQKGFLKMLELKVQLGIQLYILLRDFHCSIIQTQTYVLHTQNIIFFSIIYRKDGNNVASLSEMQYYCLTVFINRAG